MRQITIVIPIYGGVEHTTRAIQSVIEFGDLDKNSLIVINDGGPEKDAVRAACEKLLAGVKNVRYIENPSNLGFVMTCNRAVEEVDETDNDILLLNSDAALTKGAIAELQEVLAISEHHGAVGPRTNEGTIATFPRFSHHPLLPTEAYALHKEHAKQLHRYGVVPVVPGFCILIRRSLIRRFGLFDPIYSPGYDEENDFCLRINEVGYSSILANHAFVFHESGASFGSSSVELKAEHAEILKSRFPYYQRTLNDYLTLGIDPVDTFIDFLQPSTVPRILVQCTRLGLRRDGTSKNILSFIHFVADKVRHGAPIPAEFTFLVRREAIRAHGLQDLPIRVIAIEDQLRERFDLGFALSPVWTTNELLRLNKYCARIAISHLDIIGLRVAQLRSRDRYRAVSLATEFADETIFISEASRQDYLNFDPTAVIRKSVVIAQGSPHVDAAFARADSSGTRKNGFKHFSGKPNKTCVLIVGNGFKHKQVDQAIEVLEEHEQFEVIALSGHDAEHDNVQVIASGRLPDSYINSLYESADVIVFPSAYEGFGLPLAHAADVGKPAVVFRSSAAVETVETVGSQKLTRFFEDFEDLPALIEAAATLSQGKALTAETQEIPSPVKHVRSLNDYNADLVAELIRLCKQPVDVKHLRARSRQLSRLAFEVNTSTDESTQLQRKAVRWAVAVTDNVWAPLLRIFRQ